VPILPQTRPFGVVYTIENSISHTVYIGITTRKPYQRWSHHLWLLRSGKHYNGYLQNAWNKYGESAFAFSVLEEYDSQTALDEAEQFYIGYLRSLGCQLYNQKSGGGFGGAISAEARAKIGAAHRGKPKSATTRQRMSEAFKGQKKHFTPEGLARSHEASRQAMQRPEYRAKRAEIAKRLKLTDEIIQRRTEGRIRNAGIIYYLTDLNGVEHTVTNLTKFCQEHGLNKSSVKNLFNGPNRVQQYRGWTGRKGQRS